VGRFRLRIAYKNIEFTTLILLMTIPMGASFPYLLISASISHLPDDTWVMYLNQGGKKLTTWEYTFVHCCVTIRCFFSRVRAVQNLNNVRVSVVCDCNILTMSCSFQLFRVWPTLPETLRVYMAKSSTKKFESSSLVNFPIFQQPCTAYRALSSTRTRPRKVGLLYGTLANLVLIRDIKYLLKKSTINKYLDTCSSSLTMQYVVRSSKNLLCGPKVKSCLKKPTKIDLDLHYLNSNR